MNKGDVFYIQLNISATEFHNYYAQNINSVMTLSHDGRRIQFPASALQRFVTQAGVQGQFKLVIDNNAKLQSISRV